MSSICLDTNHVNDMPRFDSPLATLGGLPPAAQLFTQLI